jgi:hypothetical protein
MTTERAARVPAMTADERAARLAALQQRRGDVRAADHTAIVDSMAAARALKPNVRRRRRHAAAGARILAGTLSAATGVVLMGAMAESPTNATATPGSHGSGTSAPKVIIAPQGASNGTSPTSRSAAPRAPRVTVGTSPPITTSQGS